MFISDCQPTSHVNLSDARGASEKADLGFETEVLTETLENNEYSVLVLPARIPCEVRYLNIKVSGMKVSVPLSHSYCVSFENKSQVSVQNESALRLQSDVCLFV